MQSCFWSEKCSDHVFDQNIDLFLLIIFDLVWHYLSRRHWTLFSYPFIAYPIHTNDKSLIQLCFFIYNVTQKLNCFILSRHLTSIYLMRQLQSHDKLGYFSLMTLKGNCLFAKCHCLTSWNWCLISMKYHYKYLSNNGTTLIITAIIYWIKVCIRFCDMVMTAILKLFGTLWYKITLK